MTCILKKIIKTSFLFIGLSSAAGHAEEPRGACVVYYMPSLDVGTHTKYKCFNDKQLYECTQIEIQFKMSYPEAWSDWQWGKSCP